MWLLVRIVVPQRYNQICFPGALPTGPRSRRCVILPCPGGSEAMRGQLSPRPAPDTRGRSRQLPSGSRRGVGGLHSPPGPFSEHILSPCLGSKSGRLFVKTPTCGTTGVAQESHSPRRLGGKGRFSARALKKKEKRKKKAISKKS